MQNSRTVARLARGGSLTAILGLVLLTSCTTIPRVELDAYNTSFEAAQSAAAPIIADFGVAERADRLGKLLQQKHQRGYFATFEPSDVPAVATTGLPPGAAALDGALSAVARYNDTLLSLAEGRNIEEARVQLRAAATNLSVVAAAGGGVAATLAPAADALVNALTPAIQAGNAREFRRLVLEGHPHVIRLVTLMKGATPDEFEAITAPLRRREAAAAPADRAAIGGQIDRWHTVFADYYMLLDAMTTRLDALRDVVRQPRRESPLALAARGSAELRVYAEALRRSISELHMAP
jgi:hypothetical protein